MKVGADCSADSHGALRIIDRLALHEPQFENQVNPPSHFMCGTVLLGYLSLVRPVALIVDECDSTAQVHDPVDPAQERDKLMCTWHGWQAPMTTPRRVSGLPWLMPKRYRHFPGWCFPGEVTVTAGVREGLASPQRHDGVTPEDGR